jgi:hypothetical protein
MFALCRPHIFPVLTSRLHYAGLASLLCRLHILATLTSHLHCAAFTSMLKWPHVFAILHSAGLELRLSSWLLNWVLYKLQLSECLAAYIRNTELCISEVVLEEEQFQYFNKCVHARWLLHYSFSSRNNIHTVKSFILQTAANTLGLQCIHESTTYCNIGFTYQ